MSTEELQQDSSLAEDLEASIVYNDDEGPDAGDPENTPDEAPQEAQEGDEPEQSGEPTQEEVEAALEALSPPEKWDRRYKEVFNAWAEHPNGREWQEAILDYYKEQQGYTTQVEQERAELRRQYEQAEQYLRNVSGVVQPYQQFLAEAGVTPDQAIRQGLGLMMQLRQDPKATLKRLAELTRTNLSSDDQEEWKTPEQKMIEELNNRLNQMQETDQQRQQRQAQEALYRRQEETERQLNAFAEAKDESGNLTHPHLEKVQGVMAELINGREAVRKSNPGLEPLTLDDAYERACQLTPEVAQAVQQGQEAARLSRADREAKQAREATKRVKTGSAGSNKTKKSLRDDIAEALELSNS